MGQFRHVLKQQALAGQFEDANAALVRLPLPLRDLPTWLWPIVVMVICCSPAAGQAPDIRYGGSVPHEVREIYDRGLQYLAASQGPNGDWPPMSASGPGITGLGLMAFLASGEDPNFGLYSRNVHAAVRSIIAGQDAGSGMFGGSGHGSMYHHGFAMLALAEAYGAVDDRALWADTDATNRRSLGEALELAVRTAVTSQKRNPRGAWRYSPNAQDADTSVSGAVFMGLLAARNAGIEVPDESIDQALAYYQRMTSAGGEVGYEGVGNAGQSTARSSIATLVFAIARRKELPQYKAALGQIKGAPVDASNALEEYTAYYQAQALFQGDPVAWDDWNKQQVRRLKGAQQPDGSFQSGYGPAFGTSMSLLVLALNYRYLPIYER